MTELSTDRRFHNLTEEQVQTLHQVLTEVIPIHGRGNFPTLEVKPKDIIHVVKDRLVKREIKVRDVRLNGSTASHVLVKENGTSYKDLDIIFGVELPRQEDFQIIKEVVLGCLLDFLPHGVNKDKITALTMKEAYVQKMVKVFNEHDRWSLISLSNNRGKNVELKFVNSLRRQFEFSVDSFQIILDRMLESYLEAERRQVPQCQKLVDEASSAEGSRQLAPNEEPPSTSYDLNEPPNQLLDLDSIEAQTFPNVDDHLCQNEEVVLQEDDLPQTMEAASETAEAEVEVVEMMEPEQDPESVSTEVDLEPEVKVELEVLPVLEELTDASPPETHSHVEASPETENSQSSETQACIKLLCPEAKDIPCESISSIDNSVIKESASLKVPCQPPTQPSTTITEETQNLYLEHPLPPPPKKTCKKSQMVVLKHSSPKPPRKMSKKVTAAPVPPEKTALVNEFPVLTNHVLDSVKTQSNTCALEEKVAQITDYQESKSSNSQDKECQVELLAVPTLTHLELTRDRTPEPHDTESQVETMCSQRQNHELETHREEAVPHKPEPECEEKNQEPEAQQHRAVPSSHTAEVATPPSEPPAVTVVAESMYGDFEQAMDHLRYRLIATRNPEEIRGGGLLKYSNLLVREFKPASETEIKTLERYMCSRFFIDFPDVHEQQRKIESYLRNHFIGEESSKYDYLMTLRRVVNESTVCLMGHERRQTLNMITVLALKVLGEQNAIPNTTNVTCFYQPAPYMADHNFSNYYIAHSQPPLIYHPYPLHIHMQTGLV